MKVVVDTNVLLSALRSSDSPPGKIIDAHLEDLFTLVLSPSIIEEAKEILLRPKVLTYIQWEPMRVGEFLAFLFDTSFMAAGSSIQAASRDPDDDVFLAAAVEAQADYLVTGDDDLLVLGEYEGIKILTPRQFLDVLSGME